MSKHHPEMQHGASPLDRRAFLRRAATVAGALTAAGATTTNLTGCCDPSPAAPPIPVPSAPSNLTARPLSSTQIDLSWTDNASDETGFEVERADSGGPFLRVATLGSDALTYADSGLTGATSYAYRVRAVNAGGASDYSNSVSAATFPTPAGAPAAPTSLSGAELTTTGLILGWTDNAGDESSYRIEERIGDGEFTTRLTLASDATTLVVTGLASDTRYEFRVRAVNEAGASDPSNILRVRTGAVIELLSVSAAGTPGRLVIGWNDRAAGAVAFRIERRIDSGAFETVGSVTSVKREYVDEALVPGSRHAYRVSGEGELSLPVDEVVFDVPGLPAAPVGLSAVNDPADGSRVLLAWSPGEGGAPGEFHLERKGPLESFVELTLTPDSGATSHVDSGATPLNPYDYRVRASNVAGYSAYTAVVSAQQRAVFASGASTISGSIAGVLSTIGRGAAVSIRRNAQELGSGCRTNSNPTRVWLIRKSETEVSAVMAHCTHACLTLPSFQWQEANARFVCAHGSTFTVDGQIVNRAVSGQGSVPTLRAELFADRIEVYR